MTYKLMFFFLTNLTSHRSFLSSSRKCGRSKHTKYISFHYNSDFPCLTDVLLHYNRKFVLYYNRKFVLYYNRKFVLYYNRKFVLHYNRKFVLYYNRKFVLYYNRKFEDTMYQRGNQKL
jgi:hypothetical protein